MFGNQEDISLRKTRKCRKKKGVPDGFKTDVTIELCSKCMIKVGDNPVVVSDIFPIICQDDKDYFVKKAMTMMVIGGYAKPVLRYEYEDCKEQ